MSKEQIRDMLGQPDDIGILAPDDFVSGFDEADESNRRDLWNYGPFGTYLQTSSSAKHITKYRLQVVFVGDKVVEWTKSAPLPHARPRLRLQRGRNRPNAYVPLKSGRRLESYGVYVVYGEKYL